MDFVAGIHGRSELKVPMKALRTELAENLDALETIHLAALGNYVRLQAYTIITKYNESDTEMDLAGWLVSPVVFRIGSNSEYTQPRSFDVTPHIDITTLGYSDEPVFGPSDPDPLSMRCRRLLRLPGFNAARVLHVPITAQLHGMALMVGQSIKSIEGYSYDPVSSGLLAFRKIPVPITS
jgi:hypothetical protein